MATIMKTTRMTSMLLLALLALPFAAFAENDEASTKLASTTIPLDDVSQISLSDLRRNVYNSEEEFYSFYNKLNDDNEYDVRCFYEKITGTRVASHVCRAKFVATAYEAHVRRNRNDLSRVGNKDSIPIPEQKMAKYLANMETLIAENPELAAAFTRYNTARVLFFAKREEISNR